MGRLYLEAAHLIGISSALHSSMPKNSQQKKQRAEAAAATDQSFDQACAEAWQQFGAALAAALNDLDGDEFLVISAQDTECYIQFAGQEGGGMRAEAQSNTFIEKKFRLSKARQHLLLSMGWNKPTYVPSPDIPEPSEGSCNYYVDAAAPVSFQNLATLGVNTLRQVYGVSLPGELTYAAFSHDGDSIRFPTLGIARRALENDSPEREVPTNEETSKPAVVAHSYVFYPSHRRIQ